MPKLQLSAARIQADLRSLGGMKAIGEALGLGMILVSSLWMDHGSGMLWLDGTTSSDSTSPGAARGPCSADSGDVDFLAKTYPDTQVTFSNIKVGDIGSTLGAIKMGSLHGKGHGEWEHV